MLNHLMHCGTFQPALASLPGLVTPGDTGALTPPHSTSARSNDNLYRHYHDLVAISMGTGGWVSKNCYLLGSGMPGPLSQNVMMYSIISVCDAYVAQDINREHL